MNETLSLILALATGLALGAIFFGGLWWTVQKGMASKWSPLWFCGSWLLRTALVVTGFLVVANGHWARLLVCLVGFVMARLIVIRLIRAADKPVDPPRQGVVHRRGQPSFLENAPVETCHAS